MQRRQAMRRKRWLLVVSLVLALAVARRAWETSLVVLQGLASAAIVTAIVAAWLALPLALGLLFWRLARGRPLAGS